MAYRPIYVAAMAVAFAALHTLADPSGLAPPAGPVTTTMKTLDQVRPGVPICTLPGSADAVHVISEGGVYLLTEDLIGEPGKHGIRIDTTEPYTIVLDGHEFIGQPGTRDAIHAAGPGDRKGMGEIVVVIKTIRTVISGWDEYGINVENAQGLILSGVRVTQCALGGIRVADVARVRVEDCETIGNSGHGLELHLLGREDTSDVWEIEHHLSTDNSADGIHVTGALAMPGVGANAERMITLRDTASNNNGGHGKWIEMESASLGLKSIGGSTGGNGGDGTHVVAGPGATVEVYIFNETSLGDGGHGLSIEHAPGVGVTVGVRDIFVNGAALNGVRIIGAGGSNVLAIQNGIVRSSGRTGIHVSNSDVIMDDTISSSNGASGIVGFQDGVHLTDCSRIEMHSCSFDFNGGEGLRIDQTVAPIAASHARQKAVQASNNAGSGIVLNADLTGTLTDCITTGNNGFGIYCGPGFRNGRIEGNACSENLGGLQVDGTGNFVASNSATIGPLGGITILTPGNTAGPIIDAATIAGNCNPHANVHH